MTYRMTPHELISHTVIAAVTADERYRASLREVATVIGLLPNDEARERLWDWLPQKTRDDLLAWADAEQENNA